MQKLLDINNTYARDEHFYYEKKSQISYEVGM